VKSSELLRALERIRKDVKRRNNATESSFNQEAGHAAGQALDHSTIPQAEAGKGLNRALRAGDGRKR
jgi:hypothetical protein